MFPLFLLLLERLATGKVFTRRFWTLPRPQNWFSVLLVRRDFWWKAHFRVSREIFRKIVEIVRTVMATQDNRFRPATSLEVKVPAAYGV